MKKKNKLICVFLIVLMFFSCIGAGKNDPLLNPEKTIIYKSYDINDIGSKVNKNEDIVFIGEIIEVNKSQKNVKLKSGIYTIDVVLPEKLTLKKNDRIEVFGRIEKKENNIVNIKAQKVYIAKIDKLNYTFYFDIENGYSTNKYRKVGNFKYDIPNTWVELDGSEIFNSYLKDDAACYMISDNEYASIFYFKYETFVKNSKDFSRKNGIESAIIKNICPAEKGGFSFIKRIPQASYEKPYADNVKIDAYVADGVNWHVEFSFQEVDGGLIVVVYQYNQSKEHFRDVLYMMRTIS